MIYVYALTLIILLANCYGCCMKTVTLRYNVCAQRAEMAQREVERLKEQLASGQSATTGSCHPAEGTSRVRIMCIGL